MIGATLILNRIVVLISYGVSDSLGLFNVGHGMHPMNDKEQAQQTHSIVSPSQQVP